MTPVGSYDNNTIAFPTPAPGAFPVIVADFDFRLTPVQGRGRADGLGFALLNAANHPAGPVPPTSGAEEPSFAGSIGLGFDLYKNEGDIGNANITPNFSDSVSIHYDGKVIGQVDLEKVTDIGNGQWHHARVLVRQTGGGDLSQPVPHAALRGLVHRDRRSEDPGRGALRGAGLVRRALQR